MDLTKRAVWAPTDGMDAPSLAKFAQQVEAWGYSALWIPDAMGRDPLVAASWMLGNTETLIVATGIANLSGRDVRAMTSGQIALAEQSGGRFLLGLKQCRIEGLAHFQANHLELVHYRLVLRRWREAGHPAPAH